MLWDECQKQSRGEWDSKHEVGACGGEGDFRATLSTLPIGSMDPQDKVNTFRTQRVPVEEFTRWAWVWRKRKWVTALFP